MSEEKPFISLKKEIFKSPAFITSMNIISSFSFGGKQDSALLPVIEKITKEEERYNKLKVKKAKEIGAKATSQGLSFHGVTPDKINEFETYMDDVNETTFELPIREKLKLTKRKKHTYGTIHVVQCLDFIMMDFGNDEGGDE